ncbi:type II toxin-antitoxin system RelE family toxin [Candidatus Nanohalobium constans]|uniref:mRNA interferase RelE/StbE n=1 Tax=Candidatus Nanohalobium constans TaxID=2565781 RepID=A0A5Q0UFM8_9ARCH|nr:type II toxin-antitoxin system RelE/ParE family toxin [Candidatus Nanohalobium constans]QGA80422.1 mRNA interferase RelE/StbE [Candidatus Nanohalobium constans]
MKLEVRDGAVEDLKEMDEQVQRQIRTKMEELRESPLGENTSLMSKQGLEIFRLKLKDDELDHRVFFKLDGRKVVVLGVEHRDDAYTQKSIQRIKARV